MKTSMTINRSNRSWKLLTGILAAGLLLGGLTACRTTHQVGQSEKDFSGFLGDYSMLKKGDGNEANYVYVNTNADWKKYTKVYIKPVQLWKSDEADSPFGKMTVFVTDGHLPWPYGREVTGYAVSDLAATLARARDAGAVMIKNSNPAANPANAATSRETGTRPSSRARCCRRGVAACVRSSCSDPPAIPPYPGSPA